MLGWRDDEGGGMENTEAKRVTASRSRKGKKVRAGSRALELTQLTRTHSAVVLANGCAAC